MTRIALLIASALVASSALAQTTGSCEVGTSQAFLDVSDVQASLFNNGALFFGGSTVAGDGYFVPRESGDSPLFAAALWIGGKVNGEVRVSHSRYGGRQMWPGPLNEGAMLPNPSDCSVYDRIYTVSTYDVAIYEQTGVASSDLDEWPVGLGAPAVDASGQPVVATSQEQTLELANGERPVISGTQTAFWVMNDVGNEHTERNEARETVVVPPLGVEVAVTAFAVVSEETALNQGTFYQYTVTNRNASSITDAYFGFYIDPDLGDAGDDYVGVDTTRGMAFVYNTYEEDSAYGIPPALGFHLLDGLGSFVRPLKSSTDPVREPVTSGEVYNRLQGLDNDGGAIREGGLGYESFGGATGDVTRFMFAGDPVSDAFWSEGNLDGNSADASPGDRLMTFGSPEFSLQPNESKTFALAVVFGQGTDRLDSITELRAASDRIQVAYNDGSLFETTASTPLLATPESLAPAIGASFHNEWATLSWASVPGATRYRVEQSLTLPFRGASFRYSDSTSWFPGGWRSPFNQPVTGYWRVRAENETQIGQFSPARHFTTYFYSPSIRLLEDGTPAIVEVSGPGGIDPCGPQAQTQVGCKEIGAHRILDTPNSTGQFLLSSSENLNYTFLQRFGPSEFEIRVTGSSFVHNAFEGDETYEVPYEVWDIGMVRPGEPNDPSDDVRLIPLSYTRAEDHDVCAFDFGRVADNDGRVRRITDRIYARYPTSSYEAYEAYVRPLVEADPAGCPVISTDSLNPFLQSQVFRRAVFEDLSADSSATVADLDGMVVRFYTNDPLLVAEEATPRADGFSLGPAYPNPAASSLTVPYRLASSELVELAVYDVLGREVIELVTARQLEGAHTAQLDASALAPGVYVVRLRAGEDTRSTRITVVR